MPKTRWKKSQCFSLNGGGGEKSQTTSIIWFSHQSRSAAWLSFRGVAFAILEPHYDNDTRCSWLWEHPHVPTAHIGHYSFKFKLLQGYNIGRHFLIVLVYFPRLGEVKHMISLTCIGLIRLQWVIHILSIMLYRHFKRYTWLG